MRTMKLGKSGLSVPVIAVGCMRMSKLSTQDAERFIQTSLELGLNFFDHADIYGGGKCEEVFASAIGMNGDVRDKLILQSKCGIRKGRYDFSKEHILASVDGTLKRLGTEYLDVLLLHRPDALVEPEEVAEALNRLRNAGKVRNFGVSNHNPAQIELLQTALGQAFCANQLQLSVTDATMISAGTHVNMQVDAAMTRDGSVLDYCRLHQITVQPWSPYQSSAIHGVFLGNEAFPALNETIAEVAANYQVSDTTIAMTWLLRHPAQMQPVTGTMNPDRLRECAKAAEIALTREEWYQIHLAAGNTLP